MADGDNKSNDGISLFNAAAFQGYSSGWVFQFVFGDVEPRPSTASGSQVNEIPRLAVGVPWPLAKAIHQILGAAIAAYEMQQGEIGVPRSVQEQIDKQLAALPKG